MRPVFPPAHPDPPPRFERLESRTLFAVDLGGSLIAHWTFEGQIGSPVQIADVSPGGNDHVAVPQDDAVITANPTGNQVLQLDGNDDALATADSTDINLGIQSQRSVAFWFRVDDAGLKTRKQIIYEEGGTTRGLVMYVFNQRLYVGGWNTPVSESGWAGTWLNTAGVESGRWHHAALVLDGTAATTPNAMLGYLDGQRFAQGEGSQLWQHSDSVTVGDHGDGTLLHDGTLGGSYSAGFAGQLDDGRVYNRVLIPAEVALLARGPAVAQAQLAEAATRLDVHELEFTLAPPTLLNNAIDTPQNLNAQQKPDYPSRATPPPVDPGDAASFEMAPRQRIDVWTALAQPHQLWPEFSAWAAQHAVEINAHPELADVDPAATPLR